MYLNVFSYSSRELKSPGVDVTSEESSGFLMFFEVGGGGEKGRGRGVVCVCGGYWCVWFLSSDLGEEQDAICNLQSADQKFICIYIQCNKKNCKLKIENVSTYFPFSM